ncbi:protein held out wings-like isoform X2 [Limulus polyphemus]|uniref:Protein held out wings-like isoform X2 n=1 Tax=Limulus polyphemus TaxID=6850 RepID=A0ABM1SHU0_LIMPO|nr:protein held out wings-like isoform X2 [Limulus polyphemus]
MEDHYNNNAQSTADYLAQLLKDKSRLVAFPNFFTHLERLLDEEITKVRNSLFQINGTKKEPLVLPEPVGEHVTIQEKVFVPVKDYPDYNFVGRILGPKGLTTKMLEQETGCRIMVRGKGSMRDKKKEEQYKGKPNYEHLNEELHVLIQVDDSQNRANLKMDRAVREVKRLLIPVTDGEDELKKRQLMELAIIRGTYRDSGTKTTKSEALPVLAPPLTLSPHLRTAAPIGAPLILSHRLPLPTSAALINGSIPPPLINPQEAGLVYNYTPYTDYQYTTLTSPPLTEYHTSVADAGATDKEKKHVGVRAHPYSRTGILS